VEPLEAVEEQVEPELELDLVIAPAQRGVRVVVGGLDDAPYSPVIASMSFSSSPARPPARDKVVSRSGRRASPLTPADVSRARHQETGLSYCRASAARTGTGSQPGESRAVSVVSGVFAL
jgi:hypothetical protein